MKLKQIRIEFSPLQDWLLMRIATDANTEVLLWLTRRCVKLLWPALMGLAQKSPDILLQSHPDAKTALLGMRHEAAVQKGDFSQPYDETALVRPLGQEPMLVSKIQTRREDSGQFVLSLMPEQGQGINVALDEALLHSLCKLLQTVVSSAQWELELKLPGVAPVPGEGAGVTLN